MKIWDWAVVIYARPGVSRACLEIQDRYNQNIPLLLAAAWAAFEGRTLPLERAIALTRDWDASVVQPIRGVRRGLKAPWPGVRDDPRELLRQRVKAVELDAEHVLLNAYEEMTPAPDHDPTTGITVVMAAATAWAKAGDFPLPPLTELKHLAGLICYDAGA